jgi:hypothetical protein
MQRGGDKCQSNERYDEEAGRGDEFQLLGERRYNNSHANGGASCRFAKSLWRRSHGRQLEVFVEYTWSLAAGMGDGLPICQKLRDRSSCHEDDENVCNSRHHSLQVSFNRMIKLQYVANHQC